MKCMILYRHPVNGNQYYFCRFDKDSNVPIGCFSTSVLHRNVGMVFDSRSDALQIVSRLKSQGYTAELVDYRRIEMERAEIRYRMYPGSDDKKTEYISARIDSESKKLLEEIAIREDRTFSYLVNRIIKDYLKSQSPTHQTQSQI